MNVETIVAGFKSPEPGFREAEVKAAVAQQEAVTPHLLAILEETLDMARHRPDEMENRQEDHIYALHLLAQFRETRAHPLVVEFARLPEDALGLLLGDLTAEELHRYLASTCGGDTADIERIVEDPEVCAWARAAALRAMGILVAEGDRSRDEMMAYLHDLLTERLEREPTVVWSEAVALAVELHPAEVYAEVMKALEEGLAEMMFVSPESVEKSLMRDKENAVARFRWESDGYVRDTRKDMRLWQWPGQREEPGLPAETAPYEPEPAPPREKEPPRNAPCPCGSGRKYKKCCGRLDL